MPKQSKKIHLPPSAPVPAQAMRQKLLFAALPGLALLAGAALDTQIEPIAFVSAGALCLLILAWQYWSARDTQASAAFVSKQETPDQKARRALIEALPEAVFYIGQHNRVECANAKARQRFLIDALQPLVPVATRRPEVIKAIAAARTEGHAQSFTFVERDETDTHFSGVAVPLADSDSSDPGIIVVIRDLTEIRRAEMWRADFLANASHELRTPLASLSGLIETLQGSARSDDVARDRFLIIMREQADRMSRLVDDLLVLSRIELHEHTIPKSEADLAMLASQVTNALTPLAEEKSVNIRLNGPESGLHVSGDSDELAQLIENLVSNAIKYGGDTEHIDIDVLCLDSHTEAMSRAGRQWAKATHVSIISALRPLSGPHIALRVADHGPGIERRHLPRLAERFYRVDPGRGLIKGTGLGLAIVKHTVMRHRGEFMVESSPGYGTAFGIVLPTRQVALDQMNDDVLSHQP